MHETSFADATRPVRVQVLKRPLLNFSIGHRLLLLQRRNPFFFGENYFNALPNSEQQRAVKEAAWICSNTIERNESQPFLFFKVKLWLWQIRNENYPLAIAEMRNYLAIGGFISTDSNSSTPGALTMPLEPVASETPGRALGAPFEATLIQFLIKSLHKTEAEAMNYPFALAQFHYYTHCEREGGLQIVNHAEIAFSEYCRQEDAKEAAQNPSDGGASVPASRASSGLATPPPDLDLKGDS